MSRGDDIVSQFERNYDGSEELISKSFVTRLDLGSMQTYLPFLIYSTAERAIEEVDALCEFIHDHRNDILETLNCPEMLW